MIRMLLAVSAILALAVAAGCADGGDAPAGPTATPGIATPTADQSAPTPPPLTGIAAVDAAIDAIERQDADALLSQLRLSRVPCASSAIAFPSATDCNGESGAGTFESFPVGGCSEQYLSRRIAEQVLGAELVPRAQLAGLQAIYTTAGSRFDGKFFAPANASHVVVLESVTAAEESRGALLLGNEGIVGYAAACSASTSRFIWDWGLTDALFPLPTPTPRPTPALTGISSVDTAVDAIRRQDGDALIEQIRLSPVPCEERPFGLSPFPACDGEPDGTLFQRFPVSRCEGVYTSLDGAEQTLRNRVTAAEFEVYVYAVYSAAGSRFVSGAEFASGFYGRANPEYVVVVENQFAGDYGTIIVIADALLLNDDGVVGYSGGCGGTPAGFISDWELSDAIIPPPDER